MFGQRTATIKRQLEEIRNGGLFETLLTEDDAVICDELNHASIIARIHLCKAQWFRY